MGDVKLTSSLIWPVGPAPFRGSSERVYRERLLRLHWQMGPTRRSGGLHFLFRGCHDAARILAAHDPGVATAAPIVLVCQRGDTDQFAAGGEDRSARASGWKYEVGGEAIRPHDSDSDLSVEGNADGEDLLPGCKWGLFRLLA